MNHDGRTDLTNSSAFFVVVFFYSLKSECTEVDQQLYDTQTGPLFGPQL